MILTACARACPSLIFLSGFLLGAFIGPIMVIWLWQNMPRRQKLGLALGILCNIIYNVVRVSMADKQAAVPTGPPTPSPSHIIYYALSWSPAFR